MEDTKLVSQSSTLRLIRKSFESHEDVVMGIPNFTTIERFLLVGGGKATISMTE